MAKGRVFKRGKYWYLDYYTGRVISGEYERVRRRAQGTSKVDAQVELEEVLYRLNRASRVGEALDNRYPLQMALDDWKAHLLISVSNPETRRGYVQQAERAVYELSKLGVSDVSEVSAASVTDMLGEIVLTNSNNVANKVLAVFRRMLEHCVKCKRVLENPVKDVQPLACKRVKYRRAFKVEEVEALLEHSTEAWRPFYYCAVSTGMRQAELVNLLWQDVDFERGTVNVVERSDWKPKTEAGVRAIPMSDGVRRVLQELPRFSEYVFCTRNGTKRTNNILRHFGNVVRRMLKALHPGWDDSRVDAEKALLDFHALRYTFCTTLINKGVDVKTVQRIMGHSNIQTTLNIYAQYCDGSAKAAVCDLPW